MRAKIGVMIAGIALATLVVNRVGNLGAGRGFSGSIAWAQEADDSAADAASQDDATSQDDSAAQDSADSTEAKTIVSAGGVYSGTVMDNDKGAGTISAAISQIHAKLIGTWQDTFVPPAFIVGTITAKGKISMRMRFHLTGNCGYLFTGVFENGNEISGSYTLSGCKGMAPDHGTLQMTKQ
jgi:hypothetical protein